jgi:hypothetical protein
MQPKAFVSKDPFNVRFPFNVLDLMDDLFRIYYVLEIASEADYLEFQQCYRPESAPLLAGWYKYLTNPENDS